MVLGYKDEVEDWRSQGVAWLRLFVWFFICSYFHCLFTFRMFVLYYHYVVVILYYYCYENWLHMCREKGWEFKVSTSSHSLLNMSCLCFVLHCLNSCFCFFLFCMLSFTLFLFYATNKYPNQTKTMWSPVLLTQYADWRRWAFRQARQDTCHVIHHCWMMITDAGACWTHKKSKKQNKKQKPACHTPPGVTRICAAGITASSTWLLCQLQGITHIVFYRNGLH